MTGQHSPGGRSPRRRAFVIMPFDPAFDRLHQEAIRPALESLGLAAERYDDAPRVSSVLDEMRRSLGDAQLVIAVLTGRNPHVFFELGITLAYLKPCVLLAASVGDIPDFLHGLPHVLYAGEPASAYTGLLAQLPQLLAVPQPGR